MKKAILVSSFNYYENRLVYFEELLESKDFEVTYVTSNIDHISKKEYTIERLNVIQISTLRYESNISIKRLLSHIIFSYKTYRFILKSEANLVYIMLPPNLLLYLLAKIKKKKFVLIADIYDLWPETFPVNSRLLKLPFKIWKRIRDSSFGRVDLVLTECDLYQEVLQDELIGVQKETLYLTKEKYEKVNDDVVAKDDSVISICYLGSINHIINQDLIIRLLDGINKKKKVFFHIIGDGESREVFLTKCEKFNIEYQFHGKVFDQKEKHEILKTCDFGINIMKQSVKVGLTMKSMDYFSASLPLLNNIKSDTHKIVDKYGVGINICENQLDMAIDKIVNLSSKEIKIMKNNVSKMHSELFSIKAFKEKLKFIYNTYIEKTLLKNLTKGKDCEYSE